MKAAAYVRVSTGKQDLDVQQQELREFAARKGWELVATYSDVASGAKEDRLNFRQLLADATRGRFGAVIVQRFDRAARSVRQLVETLEHLRRCRIAFVSLKEDIDTTTPAGELIFHVMAAIAQFERALIGDRIRSGLFRARALGKRLGRPKSSVGHDQVARLRQEGLSYRSIGRRLHISPVLAHRLVRDLRSKGGAGRSETSAAGSETSLDQSV
jgi:DNA invertase Pin-like site-specific DNA recombinase